MQNNSLLLVEGLWKSPWALVIWLSFRRLALFNQKCVIHSGNSNLRPFQCRKKVKTLTNLNKIKGNNNRIGGCGGYQQLQIDKIEGN